jgi:hypothetical protein
VLVESLGALGLRARVGGHAVTPPSAWSGQASAHPRRVQP